MKFSTILVASVVICMGVETGFLGAQQADFFWSTRNLNEGAVNVPIDEPFETGDTGSIFLYYSTNGPADSDMGVGFFLDIESSVPGVLRFVGAETLDFDITVAGTAIGNRLLDNNGNGGAVGETGSVTDNLIQGLAAFTITGGSGILQSNTGSVFFDEGYDQGADAFLVARVDFEMIGSWGDLTQIKTSVGTGLVVDSDCESGVIKPTISCATIRIEDETWCGEPAFGGCEIEPPPTGDMNNDGVTNLLDVEPFVDAILSGQYVYEADVRYDNSVDLMDVDPFIQLLVAQPGDPEVGDINCDGQINLQDVPCMINVLTGSDDECKTADLNGDGSVDLLDVEPLIHLLLEVN